MTFVGAIRKVCQVELKANLNQSDLEDISYNIMKRIRNEFKNRTKVKQIF